uniref:CUB domain-containing protein n=1 Tax=Astyanax mexicanus TaxID=7994 RepID=A0A3B1IJF3_ASTMX
MFQLLHFFSWGLDCSRNLTAPSGVIQSPGFPGKYPNNLECTIIIFAPFMAEIVLEFESFEMEPASAEGGQVFSHPGFVHPAWGVGRVVVRGRAGCFPRLPLARYWCPHARIRCLCMFCVCDWCV